jgi:hypothetical protein
MFSENLKFCFWSYFQLSISIFASLKKRGKGFSLLSGLKQSFFKQNHKCETAIELYKFGKSNGVLSFKYRAILF